MKVCAAGAVVEINFGAFMCRPKGERPNLQAEPQLMLQTVPWAGLRWHQPVGKQLMAKCFVCVLPYNEKMCLETDGEAVLPRCFKARGVRG